MGFLYQNLPKDLVYIIEDYAKDRTNYDKVLIELQKTRRFIYRRKKADGIPEKMTFIQMLNNVHTWTQKPETKAYFEHMAKHGTNRSLQFGRGT